MKRRAGFTLMELLIGLAIFAVFMSSLYGVYHACARSVRNCQVGFEAHLDILRFLKIAPPLITSASSRSQRARGATFKGKKDELVFTTLNNWRAVKGSPLGLVNLSLKRPDGLVLTVSPHGFLTDKNPADGIQKFVFPSIQGVTFRYLDQDKWQEEWDAAQKGALPRKVKVAFKSRSARGEELATEHVFALPIQQDLPITGP